MSRRTISLLALAVSLAASACASPTAPAPAPRQECINQQTSGICR